MGTGLRRCGRIFRGQQEFYFSMNHVTYQAREWVWALDAMMRSMQKSAIRAAGIATLFYVIACSGPPWTLDQSPDGITLRWYPDNTPDAVADSVAQVHCQSLGKNAELIAYDQDGSAQLGRYRCR
jgi:hypothetical protein